MSFTFIWVALAVCNEALGGSGFFVSLSMLQMVGLLVILITIDGLVWMLPFRKIIIGYLFSGTVQCLAVLGFGIICRWFPMHPLVLLDKVILFTFIYTGICIYNYSMRKQEAAEINKLLRDKITCKK